MYRTDARKKLVLPALLAYLFTALVVPYAHTCLGDACSLLLCGSAHDDHEPGIDRSTKVAGTGHECVACMLARSSHVPVFAVSLTRIETVRHRYLEPADQPWTSTIPILGSRAPPAC